MPGFSDYMEAAIANYINGTQMPTPPTGRFVALFNGDPTDTGAGGVEVTTTIRAAGRPAATFTRAAGVLTSNADVDFGLSAGPVSGTVSVTHFAIFDAAAGGNMIGAAAFTATQEVTKNTGVKFASGTLVFEVGGETS